MGISRLSVFNQINVNFRNYAIYTLQHRGIPSFYDSLTNVQKIILLNTPKHTVKTLSVVGDCVKTYAHGDSSLAMAINRLARPFSCAENMIIGDGFFGTQIKPVAAAARYTSVSLNPQIHEIISKYKHLITRDAEGNYDDLPIDVPLGLLLPMIGIAVGYRTHVLPRKLEHIQEFLSGKRKTLKPYFKNFNGKITSYEGSKNSWIIEGEVVVDEENKVIDIVSLPPLMKFDSFIKKLGAIVNDYDGCTVINNSKTDVNIRIKFTKAITSDFWEYIKTRIEKATKLFIQENIVFVKETKVLEYETVEDYLLDFKNSNIVLLLRDMEYQLEYNKGELEYLNAKLLFLLWMIKQQRTDAEMSEYLRKIDKKISERLDTIKARNVTTDEIKKTQAMQATTIQKIEDYKQKISTQKDIISNTDFSLHTCTKKELPLITPSNEMEGIEVGDIDSYETFTSSDVIDDNDDANVEEFD